jgi:hypothetical protein
MTSCGLDNQAVQNQTSVDSDRSAVTQSAKISETAEKSGEKEVDYYAHIKPEHREVLREWLKTKSYLRPGVEEIDNFMFHAEAYPYKANFKENFRGNMKFLRETVGENGYQYYARGDMNQDGQEDFAVLLVDTRKSVKDREPGEFALAIFNAPFRKGPRPNYFEADLGGITNSYIVFDKMTEKHLFLGKLESDALCATYYPKRKTYYFKDCIDQ